MSRLWALICGTPGGDLWLLHIEQVSLSGSDAAPTTHERPSLKDRSGCNVEVVNEGVGQ